MDLELNGNAALVTDPSGGNREVVCTGRGHDDRARSLAELTKATAVTVNTVLPGSTLTEGVEKFVGICFRER